MVDGRLASSWCVLCVVAVLGAAARADEATIDGWAQTVWGPGGRTVVHAPAAAFALEEGETWHPAASPDASLTVFEGLVRVPDDEERYGLVVEIEGGAASVVVDAGGAPLTTRLVAAGELATARVPAMSDELAVRVTFQRLGDGPARLRTLWSRTERDFVHPTSPLLFGEVRVPDEHVDAVRADRLARRGRALLDDQGCAACHAPGDTGLTSPTVAPGWGGFARVPEWVAGRASLHTDFDLPSLDADERAALATYLEHGPVAVDPADGRELFDRVGCVACHGPFSTIGTRAAAVPLRPSSSWTRTALRSLFDGDRHVAVDLADEEREALAAALAERADDSAPRGDPRLGERLFADVGCGACHEALDGSTRRPDAAAPLDELSPDAGCLSSAEVSVAGDERPGRDASFGAHPRFALGPDERDALRAALARTPRWTPHPSPRDALDRALVRHDCLACHAREGLGGPPDAWRPFFTTVGEEVDLGDEGRLPPDLTDVGARLTTHAMRRVLVDGHRARPWMATRMPLYGEAADGVAELLSRTAGLWPDAPEAWPPVDDDRVLTGRRLVGADGGMNCISCHLFADRPAAGTPGVALDGMAERLRHEWFTSWMHDPQRMRPGTRMPAFADANDSAIESVHDGDFARQLDAIWAYLTLGEFAPVPAGLEADEDVIVDVGERPRVVRTFLDDAGARGIAVGYPVGVHVAYDAGDARFVSAWEGDFLDASGAWSARGGNVSGGRGPTIWEAGDGPALVVTRGAEPDASTLDAWRAARRFVGYRLAPDGTPTFYTDADGGPRIGARLVPDVGARRLVRAWTFPDGLDAGLHVWLRADDGWTRVDDATGGVTEEIAW